MKTGRAKKKNPIIRFCMFVFTAYIVVSLVSLQMEISDKRNVLEVTMQQVKLQQTANKDLERQISLGDDKEFLERIARDKLGMGRAEERVFRDASGS